MHISKYSLPTLSNGYPPSETPCLLLARNIFDRDIHMSCTLHPQGIIYSWAKGGQPYNCMNGVERMKRQSGRII